MNDPSHARLVFPFGFEEVREEGLTQDKGEWSFSAVEIPGRGFYPVNFVILDTLVPATRGGFQPAFDYPCYAEPGLIILPDVTRANMERAVQSLYQTGYFDFLNPLSAEEMAAATIENRPPRPSHRPSLI